MKRILAIICCVFALSATATAQDKGKADKDKDNTQYRTIIDMIKRLPGVVVSPGADDGTMPQMYIRGIGTNTDATQPLFVVDGVITDNVTYLEPKDVNNIEVIKDGTASIYGMRGANGVIVITTNFAVEAQKRAAEAARAAKEAKRAARKAARQK